MALIEAVDADLPRVIKSKMTKIVEKWLHCSTNTEFTPFSKPFKNERAGGEGAREIP